MFIGTQQALLDKDFLKKLDNYTQREVYAKIISLDWDERAIAEITGYIVSGNISVDGSSSTRRTCSLTLITDNQNADINNIYWGLNTKFAVLIGLKNYIDNIHDDIIWFQQGIFIITSYSPTYNEQGITISIQGKDKMCMLDGSIGGALFADHVFSEVEVLNRDGTTTRELVTIQDLIKNAVHTYGLESYENIIITDLDDSAVELLDYKVADRDMFIYDISMDESFQYYTSQMVFENTDLAEKFHQYAPKEDDYYIPYAPFQLDNIYYRIVKHVQYGDTVGYRETDLTYAGTLAVNAGEAITKALDACVNMLGEFEYFYDIYGRFIFQRKRVYHNISWDSAITNEGESTYYDSLISTQSQYEFVNGLLISSFANKPLVNNIRNDFVVWGTTNTEAPIHLRYVIDTKPDTYTSLSTGVTYYTPDNWRFNVIGKKVYFEPGRNNGCDMRDIDIDENTFLAILQEILEVPNQIDLSGLYTFQYVYSETQGHIWQYFLRDGRAVTPAHFHFTIPTRYAGQDIVITVNMLEDTLMESQYQTADWRELLYQMALDNSRSSAYIQQLTLALNHSPILYPYKQGVDISDTNNCWYYDNSDKTWRQPREDGTNILSIAELQAKSQLIFGVPTDATKKEFMASSHLGLIDQWQNTWNTGYDYCYADLLAFWRLVYDNRPVGEIELDSSLTESDKTNRIERHKEWEENRWWNPDIIYCEAKVDDDGYALPHTLYFKNPGQLLFWLDFIGENTELAKYSTSLIGRRPKVVNDDDVKAIFFRDTPDVLFIDPTDTQPKESTINYVKLNLVGGLLNYFQISGQGKSAKEVLDNMVYDNTYYQETITITSLPIYYLEPNVRISVSDENSGIQGEYFVKSFSYSLAHDGTMSITATKAQDRIL